MKKQKKYRALLYPMYSIQFSRIRGGVNDGVLKMRETSNIKDGTEPLAKRLEDMRLFGSAIAKSDLLTKGDKIAIETFCKSFIFNLFFLK